MNCPVCAGGRTRLQYELYDDRYGHPGRFKLMRCADCGHRFLDARFSDEQISRLYTRYYPRADFQPEQYAPHVEHRGFGAWLDGDLCQAFRWVPHRVRVLDIGCGFCQTLGYHEGRGCEAWGVEADENVRAVAQLRGFKVRIGLFDGRDYEPGYFDYVTMDQVLEHMRDPLATLGGVARILKRGGRAIVSAPNPDGFMARRHGARWMNWHAPYHLQEFSRRSLALAARQAGLAVRSTRTVTSSEWLHYQDHHILTFPAEGEPSQFWSARHAPALWPAELAPKIQRLRDRQKRKLDHYLTRALDLIGQGDNHVFVLEKR